MNKPGTWLALAVVGVAIVLAIYWTFGRSETEEAGAEREEEDEPLVEVVTVAPVWGGVTA